MAGVFVVLVAVAAAVTLPGGEASSDDEGIWLRDTPTTTVPAFTPQQFVSALNTPAGRQALSIVDAVTAERPATPKLGQRAVGMAGPVGANVEGITATATLSPGARIEKRLGGIGFDPLGDARPVAYAIAATVAGLAVLVAVKR
jgi:hypothetical protein